MLIKTKSFRGRDKSALYMLLDANVDPKPTEANDRCQSIDSQRQPLQLIEVDFVWTPAKCNLILAKRPREFTVFKPAPGETSLPVSTPSCRSELLATIMKFFAVFAVLTAVALPALATPTHPYQKPPPKCIPDGQTCDVTDPAQCCSQACSVVDGCIPF
ncbi:unnamed protein product [Rhizoctonia solani]|uniref:Uncharacterized protein n=1 Tax=Rhizoctonia solani TaxID=456999 RepID=A0A8H3E5J7_9AGAM|nr:unnamed protein product [Rhizoctonia solani]